MLSPRVWRLINYGCRAPQAAPLPPARVGRTGRRARGFLLRERPHAWRRARDDNARYASIPAELEAQMFPFQREG
eukprot:3167893-Pyramimonas_sp.AAC.1